MRIRNRRLAATAAALAVAAAGTAAVADVPQSQRELVDLSVRPSAVSLTALPGAQGGFAAAYDDRLSATGVFYAARVGSQPWKTEGVASVIDGRHVGREPVVAVSRSSMRVVAFRSDMQLDPGTAPGGRLYVARSYPGKAWFVQTLDANGFGEAVAFDHEGRPSIAYLVRVDDLDTAELRLARPQPGGGWAIQALERTTFRESANGANATRVGLAFDAEDKPWIAFVDAVSRSLRLLTPGLPSERIATPPALAAQASIAFGPGGARAVAATALSGERGGLLVTRWLAGRWRSTLAAAGAATAPAVLGFSGSAPRVAFRDGGGVSVVLVRSPRAGLARVQPQRVLSERFSASSSYTGALGAALSHGTLGVAVVAPRGLLEFATVASRS